MKGPGSGPSAEEVYGDALKRRRARKPTRAASGGKYMRGKTALACNAGNVLLALRTEPELKGV
jgi:hypothetical protein